MRCKNGEETLDIRLLMLKLYEKVWVILLAAVLGVLLVGLPYFLVHVTFGPAKEYEAVTDFYVDYAKQETGEEYVYFNQATWAQLMGDNVFLDVIMTSVSDENITKEQLRTFVNATLLSDTRIVTTTVRTPGPELTMKINQGVKQAMAAFGECQKEIAEVRILSEPKEAELVMADVRTFRACMFGLIVFTVVTLLYLILYYIWDESVYLPKTLENRYNIPCLGTVNSTDLKEAAEKVVGKTFGLYKADEVTDLQEVRTALGKCGLEAEAEKPEAEEPGVLVVKAGAHNGKQIEKAISDAEKMGQRIQATLLWQADEKLIKRYYLPKHILRMMFHR